jgi:hypothetical protein
MHACVLIRQQPLYRRDSFVAGLRACGYEVSEHTRPRPGNVLVIWNRYSRWETVAKLYERAGGTVLIAENGYLGREWRDGHWYALSRNFHNGGGWWPSEPEHTPQSQQRWTSFGVDVAPWRHSGSEIVVLATRGIGPDGIREPTGWSDRITEEVRRRSSLPVRIRRHPGEKDCVPLHTDLIKARAVVTWGSGGALKALLWGIPVFHGFPKWIGASGAQLIDGSTNFDHPAMPNRIGMFRRLAWAMWSTDEIKEGAPFRCFLA